jgi:hypothetical protein
MYLHGRGRISKLMNRYLHEVLDLTPAIILTVLFCKVNIILQLGELPPKIIPYFISKRGSHIEAYNGHQMCGTVMKNNRPKDVLHYAYRNKSTYDVHYIRFIE